MAFVRVFMIRWLDNIALFEFIYFFLWILLVLND